MKARPTQSRKGVKGQLPLAGSRDSVPCGVWGNAPTVPRATSMPNALNKGAGSEASLPVTLRVRRRAPKLHIRPFAHCRAKWARPTSIGKRVFLFGAVFLHSSRISGAENAIKNKHSFVCYSRRISGHEVAIKVSCEKELFSIDQLEFCLP